MSNESMWQEAGLPEIVPPMDAAATPPAPPVEVHSESNNSSNASFTDLSLRLNENLASATLRLVDAAQDFTGLIKAYVSAGQELERSLAMVRELAAASQKALEDSRQSALEAAASAKDAQMAQQKSVELIQRSTSEHLALAELTDNLRQRISALAVLGAPIERHGSSADLTELGSRSWDAA